MAIVIAAAFLLLQILPAAVVIGVVASDLYWGVQWMGWVVDGPIYRDERPVIYWSLETLEILGAIAVLLTQIPTIADVWEFAARVVQ